MNNIVVLLGVLISVVALGGVSAASNVTVFMEDYVRQNMLQYDANLKRYEDEIANFREIYGRELRAISVQADQLEAKLTQAATRLYPIELIDSWHKQCVHNYSATIPKIAAVRTTLTACTTVAQNNLNGHLSSVQSTYTTLKSYYANNVKTMLSNCEKQNPTSQENYTACVITQINAANVYTITNQNNFATYMEQATCTAKTRIDQAWQCSFTTVDSTITTLGVSKRLIDDCIANRMTCASVSCTTRCKNHMIVSLTEAEFQNNTINNPFFGLSSSLGCMEIKFKV